MKNYLFILLLMVSSTLKAETFLECYPEVGQGSEILTVVLDNVTKKASLLVDGELVEDFYKMDFTEEGNIFAYGDEDQITIQTRVGGEIKINNNYDELVLSLGDLNLGLSDSTYMCE